MASRYSHDSLDNDICAEGHSNETTNDDAFDIYGDDFDNSSDRGGSQQSETKGSDSVNEVNDEKEMNNDVIEGELEVVRYGEISACSGSDSDSDAKSERVISSVDLQNNGSCEKISTSSLFDFSSGPCTDDERGNALGKDDKAARNYQKGKSAVKSRGVLQSTENMKTPVRKRFYDDDDENNDNDAVAVTATCGASDYNRKVTAVNTREELADFLAQNDELRARLLEERRTLKHHFGRQKSVLQNSSRARQNFQQHRKTTVAIQKAMKREETRQGLRMERQYLGALRDDLRKSVVKNKRLRSYLPLIEVCKNDIAKLMEEKRDLLLTIRQNEKVLLNDKEDQASEAMIRRLREEIKADRVLTQRALERARRDAMAAVHMHHEARSRVQQLEGQLTQKTDAVHLEMDPEMRQLYEENQQKAQRIVQLRRQLRGIKRQTHAGICQGEKEGSKKIMKKEKEELLKNIHEMRKKLKELSLRSLEKNSLVKAKAYGSLTLDKTGQDLHSRASTAATHRHSESNKKVSSSLEKMTCDCELVFKSIDTMRLEGNKNAGSDICEQLLKEDNSDKNKIESCRDDADEVVGVKEHQVERKWASDSEAANVLSPHASLKDKKGDSLNVSTKPVFFRDENHKTIKTDVEAATDTGALVKKKSTAAPPWFDGDNINTSHTEFQDIAIKQDDQVEKNENEDFVVYNVADKALDNGGKPEIDISGNECVDILPESDVSGDDSLFGDSKVALGQEKEGEKESEAAQEGIDANAEVDASNEDTGADPPAEPAQPSWLDFD